MPLDITKVAKVTSKAASSLAKAPIGKITVVDDMIEKLLSNDIIPNTDGEVSKKIINKDLARYPYLMLLLDKNGNINNNVVAAMATAVTKYIDENKISLVKLTDKDL